MGEGVEHTQMFWINPWLCVSHRILQGGGGGKNIVHWPPGGSKHLTPWEVKTYCALTLQRVKKVCALTPWRVKTFDPLDGQNTWYIRKNSWSKKNKRNKTKYVILYLMINILCFDHPGGQMFWPSRGSNFFVHWPPGGSMHNAFWPSRGSKCFDPPEG